MSEACEHVGVEQKVLRSCQTHLAAPKKWFCREAKACPEPRAKRCQGVAGAGGREAPERAGALPLLPWKGGLWFSFKKHNLLLSTAGLRMTLN